MYRGISYLLIIAFVAFATEVTAVQSCQDTTKKYRLDSVMVKSAAKTPLASSRAFAVGTNIQRIPQESMDRIKSMSLSDLLKEQASVYIKEYGRGMASYVSVRGTSSSHTSIAWNGMSLSVPTLGQANLSQIPLYFFDRMDLHIGGSGMLYGDGSIGGSIQLSTLPLWEKGVSGDLLFSGGSFSTLYGAGTLRYSNGKTESRSSLFYTSAKNDFMFANNTKPGRTKATCPNMSFTVSRTLTPSLVAT
jgi:vitamin B12 transporter